MAVYFMLLFTALFLVLGERKIVNFPKASVSLLFLAIPMLFISMFRSFEVGSDTRMYVIDWALPEISQSSMVEIAETGRWEIGFASLAKLSLLSTDPPRMLVILTSLLIVGLSSFAILKLSDRPALAFSLIILSSLYYHDMQILRQAIAMSILQCALIPLLRKQYLRYLILVFVAFLFHKSAILLVALPLAVFLVKFRTKKSFWLIFGSMCILLLIFPMSLLNMVMSRLGYENYVGSQEYGGSNHLAPLLLLFCFIAWLISTLTTKGYTDQNVEKDTMNKQVLLAILFLGILVSCIAFKMAILYRLIPYFLALFIPLFVNDEASNISRDAKISNVFLSYSPFIGLFIMYTFLVPSWTAVFPYTVMPLNPAGFLYPLL